MSVRVLNTPVDPKEAMALSVNVFVYGTLQYLQGNHSLLRDATFWGTTKTIDKFALGDVGFPYAFPFNTVPLNMRSKLCWQVQGEMYELHSPSTMSSLDGLEGFPRHYDRKVVHLENGKSAWMYVQTDWSLADWCDACDFEEETWIWRKSTPTSKA